MQVFSLWLETFLFHSRIEDLIDQCYEHQPPDTGVMHDIWDSLAQQSLGPFTTTKNNFTFSFFIDWFNLFTNKISDKTVSCGAIMIFCLNLPYYLQYQPENTYFAGITPLPYEPSVTTITALLDPIVEQLQYFYHRQVIHTY